MGKDHRFVDHSGKQFGHWTVLHRAENRQAVTYWRCRCRCGYEGDVRTQTLTRGSTQSCGCGGKNETPKERMERHNSRWSAEEIEALIRCYPVNGSKCLKAYGVSPRSRDAIRRKAKYLGLKVERHISGRKDLWEEWEEEIVRKYYPHGGTHACLPHLKRRSKGAIKIRARELGLIHEERNWSDDEIRGLRFYRNGGATACMRHIPDRSIEAIRNMARHLGIRRRPVSWSEKDDAVIREEYPIGGAQAVLNRLTKKRSLGAIRTRAGVIGVARQVHWSNDEVNVLLKFYLSHGWKFCAGKLPGRTKDSIKTKARYLGLTGDEQIAAE